MDHYCKKVIAGKKLVLKRYISAAIYGNKTSGYAHEQHYAVGGAHSKINARRARVLSQRSGCISTTFFLKD